ncbi:LOB domain-containing protein 36 [Vitis vinifera]|uniref:LOB domain-containing protein n=2 Tax=Vitis vinifera TaxID=29760 RepID=F6H7Q9_VITVI|nr:LOB domain-containing protein 36 [Vitis vinifera]|eukprot:XP_002263136.3 PREDICTED: LOB domain-containing protein 36 [Vitis vinifera]
MSSSNSPCAACKLQRRKCTQECIYAPYFPPDQPHKFANVHKVFGASNVAKLLNEINVAHREDAVNSLAYEAEARLHDPVYGCVGLISILQQTLKQVQSDLLAAKKELSAYIGPIAMQPNFQHPGYMPQQHMTSPSSSSLIPYNMSPLGLPTGASHGGQLVIREPQPQQSQQYQHQRQNILEAQQMAAREQQEMLRTFEQQQRQQELMRFNSGFEEAGTVGAGGFNQTTAATMVPSLALGKFDNPY